MRWIVDLSISVSDDILVQSARRPCKRIRSVSMKDVPMREDYAKMHFMSRHTCIAGLRTLSWMATKGLAQRSEQKREPTELEIQLGKNLDRIMAERSLTQLDVAAATKKRPGAMNQSTVGRIIHAKASVTLFKLEALASALGIPAWQLLYPNLDPADRPFAIPLRRFIAEQQIPVHDGAKGADIRASAIEVGEAGGRDADSERSVEQPDSNFWYVSLDSK